MFVSIIGVPPHRYQANKKKCSLKNETQEEAKAVVNDIITDPNGKTLLTVAMALVIGGIFMVGSIVNYDYEPPVNPNIRNDHSFSLCSLVAFLEKLDVFIIKLMNWIICSL